jgi:hypothetical protein
MNYSKFRVFVLTLFLAIGYSASSLVAQTATIDAVGIPVKGGLASINLLPPATAVAKLRQAVESMPHPVDLVGAETTLMRQKHFTVVANAMENGVDAETAIFAGRAGMVDHIVTFASGFFPSGIENTIVLETVSLISQ